MSHQVAKVPNLLEQKQFYCIKIEGISNGWLLTVSSVVSHGQNFVVQDDGVNGRQALMDAGEGLVAKMEGLT